MQRKGLVSCITPVWNREKYIGPMLDSVLGQTYPLIEMILVDDGSDDQTLEIAESYRERFTERGYEYQIVCAPHQNASAALNLGLPLVHGEYLIWPDSDDILEQDSVEKRVDWLEENQEYGCVRSVMYYFDSKNQRIPGEEEIGDIKKENLFWDILYGRTFVCCGCYMLRTIDFLDIYTERHIPEYSVGQNFQMLLPYTYHYRCYTIPEALYGVRIHGDSHSRIKRSQKEEEERFKEFERLIDEISKICHIHSFLEKRKIICWKLQRRYCIARKYGKHLKAIKARLLLCILRGHTG